MQARVEASGRLHFDDGTPVRAASALAALGGGWLVAQDDATHGAWWRGPSTTRLRLLPPVEGLEVFSQAAGTKHLKPDLEAACTVELDGGPAVLLLGSGSTSARMRAVLVRDQASGPDTTARGLPELYARVARVLGVAPDQLNLEGACPLGDRLRWFHRGVPAADLPPGSVDVDLPALLAAVAGDGTADIPVDRPVEYPLGELDGVGLAVTDAVALADGRVLLSAAAEDTATTVDDGPVVGAALVLVDGDDVVDVEPVPTVDGVAHKVEGLALLDADPDGARVLAVVDADEPDAASTWLELSARW